jgi:SAM-dependent methyltransferase
MSHVTPRLSELTKRLFASARERGYLRTLAIIPKNLYYLATDFDRKYGTNTSDNVTGKTSDVVDDPLLPAGHKGYEGCPPRLFLRVLRSLRIDPRTFTFIDLGSGQGRALLLASRFPFKTVIGVEYDEGLHRIAQTNIAIYIRKARTAAPVQSVCADAAHFALPSGDLVLYLFNPFGPEILMPVLERILRALCAQERQILLIYQNPRQQALLDACGGFELLSVTDHRVRLKRRPIGRVAIYRSKPKP